MGDALQYSYNKKVQVGVDNNNNNNNLLCISVSYMNLGRSNVQIVGKWIEGIVHGQALGVMGACAFKCSGGALLGALEGLQGSVDVCSQC